MVDDPPAVPPARDRFLVTIGLLFLAALVSAHFAMTLAKATRIFLDTDVYVGFTANRPFQDRLLMAPVLQWLVGVLHEARLATSLARMPAYLAGADQLAYAAINAAAFFAVLLALWPLTALVHGRSSPARGLTTALFVALAYLLFCLNPNLSLALPYDIPALAFTVTALLLYRSGRWLWLFALAIKLAHLPTEQGLRLVYNAEELLKPWQWPSIFALPLLLGCAVLAVRRQLEMRDFAITALVGGALLITVAQITETRAFGELIPYLAFALVPLIQQYLSRSAPSVSSPG